jgi:hypothetical protein
MPPLAIHIPQPCTESWEAMTPTGAGRHCAACQKTVVDFTWKTDAEILAYLASASGETCGRFRREQVSKTLVTISPKPPVSRWQLWLASLLATALAMQSCQHTTGEALLTTNHPYQIADSVGVGPTVDAPYNLICGNVLDAVSRLPVTGAVVTLKNTSLRTTTDAAGYFALPESQQVDLSQTLSLEILASGYPTHIQVVSSASPEPHGGLLAVLTTFPLHENILGEIEALPK